MTVMCMQLVHVLHMQSLRFTICIYMYLVHIIIMEKVPAGLVPYFLSFYHPYILLRF